MTEMSASPASETAEKHTSKQELLVPGERVLMTLERTPLVLTNYRVKFDTRGIGNSLYQSIPLDAISFCGFMTNSQPMTLVFALLLVGVGTAGVFVPNTLKDSVLFGTVLLLVGVAFLIIYFATRSAELVIRAMCGEQIAIPSHDRKRERVIPFMEAVLEAKLRFNRKIASTVQNSGS
jgi:hypothetical protein